MQDIILGVKLGVGPPTTDHVRNSHTKSNQVECQNPESIGLGHQPGGQSNAKRETLGTIWVSMLLPILPGNGVSKGFVSFGDLQELFRRCFLVCSLIWMVLATKPLVGLRNNAIIGILKNIT